MWDISAQKPRYWVKQLPWLLISPSLHLSLEHREQITERKAKGGHEKAWRCTSCQGVESELVQMEGPLSKIAHILVSGVLSPGVEANDICGASS